MTYHQNYLHNTLWYNNGVWTHVHVYYTHNACYKQAMFKGYGSMSLLYFFLQTNEKNPSFNFHSSVFMTCDPTLTFLTMKMSLAFDAERNKSGILVMHGLFYGNLPSHLRKIQVFPKGFLVTTALHCPQNSETVCDRYKSPICVAIKTIFGIELRLTTCCRPQTKYCYFTVVISHTAPCISFHRRLTEKEINVCEQ